MKKKADETKETAPIKASPESFTLSPSTEFVGKFKSEMKALVQLYSKYQKESSDQTSIPTNELPLFFEWAFHYSEYCDEDIHFGQVKSEVVQSNKNLHKSSSKDDFMKNYLPEFFSGKTAWPVRFNSTIYFLT